MSGAWQQWHGKISTLLGVDPKRPLRDQPLPQPWFLFPVQRELTQDEAEDLFATLRSYLLSSPDGSVAGIRERLELLTPDASLPFLYGMRYIAFARAGNRRYWPHFLRMMFDNRLGYNDVAVGLASTTAELWMRLAAYTRYALYHPTEGPINIKWPLAHAGLLPVHKDTLEDFGMSLFQHDREIFDETVALESDEFVLRFLDWLRREPNQSRAPYSLLMQSTRPERFTLAELGQHWLSLESSRLEVHLSASQAGHSNLLVPRRRLHYRATSNQIGIVFSLGRLKLGQNATLIWNNQTVYPTYKDLSQQRERVFDKQFLPVFSPNWPDSARIEIAPDTSITISMPTLDSNARKSQGVVFDAKTGNQTKRWRLSEHYEVLVSGRLLDSGNPERLFAEWFDMGTPEGHWPEHRLLQVCTHNLNSLNDLSAEDLQTLEETAESLGLPSFEHHFQARVRLFGGDLLDYGQEEGPIFKTTSPPYVEVTGIRDIPRRIDFQRKHDRAGEFILLDQLRLLPGPQRDSQIIELPTHLLTQGHYRVSVDGEYADFVLVNESITQKTSDPVALHVQAYLVNSDGQKVAMPNRHALTEDTSNYKLVVKAWPGAELQLQVAVTADVKSWVFPLEVGQSGEWIAPISYLPIPWRLVPAGNLELHIGWRSLFTQTIIATDTNYCSLAEFEPSVRTNSSRTQFVFSCQGKLNGAYNDIAFYGYLLPSVPWERSPRYFSINVSEDGSFTGSVILRWQPGWFVLGDFRLLERDDSLIVAVRQLLDVPAAETLTLTATDLVQDISQHIFAWTVIANRISNVSYPVALTQYLRLADALYSLQLVLNFLTVQRSWISFNRWDEWPQLLPLIEQNAPIALFRGHMLTGQYAQPVMNVHLAVTPAKISIGSIEFSFQNAHLLTDGCLVRVMHLDVERIVLLPSTSLQACVSCGLILPRSAFRDHARPYVDIPDCSAKSTSFVPFVTGELNTSDYIAIGVLVDPQTELMRIRQYLAEFIRLQQLPSQDYRDLVNDLKPLCPDDINPAEWLAGLINALDALANLRRCFQRTASISTADVGRLGSQLVGYDRAIALVLDTLSLDLSSGFDASPGLGSEFHTVDGIQTPDHDVQPRDVRNQQRSIATPFSGSEMSSVSTPSKHATEKAPTDEQVKIILASYDQKMLDYTAAQMVRQLISVHIVVDGSLPLSNRRVETHVQYRRMIIVPAESKWIEALKPMEIPQSVQVQFS